MNDQERHEDDNQGPRNDSYRDAATGTHAS